MTPRDEIHRIMQRQRVLGEAFADGPPWHILLDLADAGPLKTTAVGASTRVPLATAIRHINALEQGGFVQRVGFGGDSRINLVSLSDTGREAVERCLA